MIDPDGKDWCEYNGNVVWKKGSGEYKDANGNKYRNIGNSYTQRVDDRTVLNYGNSPDPVSITVMAVDESIYVKQHTPKKMECKDACDQMRTNAGFSIIPRNGKEGVVDEGKDGRAGEGNANLSVNLAALMSRIENGELVTVGIDYKDGSTNHDKMTDHYISAIGYTENFKTKQVSIHYFDPAPGQDNATSRGTDVKRNLIKPSGNNLTGTLGWGTPKNRSFTVTQIRSRK